MIRDSLREIAQQRDSKIERNGEILVKRDDSRQWDFERGWRWLERGSSTEKLERDW